MRKASWPWAAHGAQSCACPGLNAARPPTDLHDGAPVSHSQTCKPHCTGSHSLLPVWSTAVGQAPKHARAQSLHMSQTALLEQVSTAVTGNQHCR